ncbi:lysozyme inhibitor LprI family protein [Akkermansia massiliensis]|uniref:lysozyme inhibitor LprI family protein n=1 Tax=Akkermansia massiliensis TaxID=2927224 RepID=UPI00202E76C3|nr:lysozyme inhibitor LprI family protein [Akkermansia sp. B2-R-115]MCM0686676.1 lysozyme inhibitor LprI family protein [Akkermansia sp. B2-R-115]
MKKKTITVMMAALLGTVFASAQESAPVTTSGKEDPELTELTARLVESTGDRAANIVRREFCDYWDRRLNKAYQALMKYYAGRPSMIAKLKKSQRAWISERDVTLSFYGLCLKGGNAEVAEDEWFEEDGWFNFNALSLKMILIEDRCLLLEYLLELVKDNEL